MRMLIPVAMSALLVACVNDGGQTGPKQGDLGGACFANDTCSGNLVCAIVNGGATCQQADAASSDAIADQAVTDSVAPSDAGDASCSVAYTRACSQACQTPTAECCAQSIQCVASSADCNGMPTWKCTAKSDCANAACCLGATVVQANACPPVLTASGGAACSSTATCGNSGYTVCTTSNDCPPTQPTCTAVQVQGIGYYVGICM